MDGTPRRWIGIGLGIGLALLIAACSDRPAPPTTPVRVPLEVLRSAAEAATDEMAGFLAETIRFASLEPAGPELLPETEALLELSLRKGEEFGFTSRRAAGGLVGVLEFGSGPEVVGVLIHLDVVDPGNLDEWEYPPFSGTIAGGRVYGRGAQDDKGALVSALWGARILIENGMTFGRRLRLILGTKEETSFEDVKRYFAEEAPPDFGFVPDGPYIVRGESGYADLGYALPGLAASGGDPRRDAIVYWDGGTAVNSVPDFSFAVLRSADPPAARTEIEQIISRVRSEFTRGSSVPDLSVVDFEGFAREHDVGDVPPGDLVVFSRGRIAHSSVPRSGRNAIVEVALVGARLSSLAENAFSRAFRFVDERIGLSTDGSGFGLATEKPIAAAADTTASLDLVTTDAEGDRVELVINFRVGVANTTREIEEKSGAAAMGYGATLREIGAVFDAYHYPDGDPLLELARQSYRTVREKEAPILALGSTTYVKAAPNLISYGPIDLAEDGLSVHATDEKTPVAALPRNAVLFAHLLQEMIQAEEAPIRE